MELTEVIQKGLPSYCTGNMHVIRSLMRLYKGLPKRKLLIEATANQVNQYGGYTGKTPEEFRNEILRESKAVDFPETQIILGGDHLGPLIWNNEKPDLAMEKAIVLVKQFAKAGYQKIHLDTSMRLGGEHGKLLSTETIARRGLLLYKACQEIEENKEDRVFIIGSEVPVPGGETYCDSLCVTNPSDAENTINVYKRVFEEGGVPEKEFCKYIKALVVQPGVEFTKDTIFQYSPGKAKQLMCIKKGNMVFEGHSTDYQARTSLQYLVRDGVKILKVGPELTYMLRIAFEKMENVESILVKPSDRSMFKKLLHDEMLKDRKYWEKYYSPDDHIAFETSYLDRSRYYLTCAKVLQSIEILKKNIELANGNSVLHKEFPQIDFCRCSSSIFENIIDYYIGLVVKRYENAYP